MAALPNCSFVVHFFFDGHHVLEQSPYLAPGFSGQPISSSSHRVFDQGHTSARSSPKLQLVLSHPPASFLATSTGLVAGYLYRTDLLLPLPLRRRALRPLKTYRIPLSIHLLLSRLFSPLVGTSQPPRRTNRVLPGQISDSGARAATSALVDGQRASLRSLLAGRQARATPSQTGTTTGLLAVPSTPVPQVRNSGAAGGARAAVGEWVSEMTGGTGAGGTGRAPTAEEIAVLEGMFPNLSREAVVRALQRR